MNSTWIDFYKTYGVNFSAKSNKHFKTECFDCGEDKLYVNSEDGTYVCKLCDHKGNNYSFIKQLHSKLKLRKRSPLLRRFSEKKGIEYAKLKEYGFVQDDKRLYIPRYGVKGTIVSLQPFSFKNNIVLNVKGQSPRPNFWRYSDRVKDTYLFESDLDGLCFLIRAIGAGKKCNVVSFPGSATFKPEWVKYLKAKKTVWCFDHDTAKGGKAKKDKFYPGLKGIERAAGILNGATANLKWLNWEDGGYERPFDVRDLYQQVKSSKEFVEKVDEITQDFKQSIVNVHTKGIEPLDVTSFDELCDRFSEKIELNPTLKRVLACSCATVLSAKTQGDPIWMFIVGPASCLAYDSRVTINRAGKSFTLTLEQLHHRFHGGCASGKYWDQGIDTYIQQRQEDGTIRKALIHDVMYSGQKKLFELKTKSGNVIRSSKDHRFMTPNGWKRLEELTVGDSVYSNGGKKSGKANKKIKSINYYVGLRYHPNATTRNVPPQRLSDGYKIGAHRITVEADMNDLTVDEFLHIVRNDKVKAKKLKYLSKKMDVHHIDRDRTNNDISNLVALSSSEHKRLHSHDDKFKSHVLDKTMEDEIISIRNTGLTEDVYDLSVDAPHNFLCEGIVVHNSGKTTILDAFAECKSYTVHRSTLTKTSLVSGRAMDEDPSILGIIDKRCLMIKDLTMLLMSPVNQLEETFGTLRDAYDDSVFVQFGNGVQRHYENLRFSWLAGVTDIIHGFNKSDAGERFLKVDIIDPGFDESRTIRNALTSLSDDSFKTHLKAATLGFMRHMWETDFENNLPLLPMDLVVKITAVSQVISYMRTKIKKDREGNVEYRTRKEQGIRVAKQLAKLAQMLCVVFKQDRLSDDEFNEYILKIAFDTCTSIQTEITMQVMKLHKEDEICSVELISENLQISKSAIQNHMTNMQEVGFMEYTKKDNGSGRRGRNIKSWSPTDKFLELWKDAGLNDFNYIINQNFMETVRRKKKKNVKTSSTPKRSIVRRKRPNRKKLGL